jgi:hypothetical protein
MKTLVQQMMQHIAAFVVMAVGCAFSPATTVVFSNLVADNAGNAQRLTDSHGTPLPAGSWVQLGSFGALNAAEISALALQDKQALLEAFTPFGAASSVGIGTASMTGRVEFAGRVALTEPVGGLHFIVFNAPSPFAANEVLVAALPGVAPQDDASGLDSYLAFHLQDSTLIVGVSNANGLATVEINGSYETWIVAQSIAGATEEDLHPTADADHDGCSNLVEYALGSQPGDASSRAGTRIVGDDGVIRIQFLCRFDDPNLDLDVETSPDMAADSWVISTSPAIDVTSPPFPAPPGFRWKEVETPASEESGFIRLRASLIP